MNTNIKIFYIAALLFTTSCNSNSIDNKQVEKKQPDTLQAIKPTKKFADIQFASKKDTTCGMPISAGIEDTLVLKEKVYGFCCSECKAEFVTVLKKQHKR
jgi:hypothetical protein